MPAKKEKEKRLLGFLKKKQQEIMGVQLDDGTLLFGQLFEIIDDEKFGIWVVFGGISPVAPKEDATLTQYIKEGTKQPDALITTGIFSIDDIHHFILGFSTNAIIEEQKQKLVQESKKENRIITLNPETQSQVTQEKIKKNQEIIKN